MRGVIIFFAEAAVFSNIYACADSRNNKNHQNNDCDFRAVFLRLIVITRIAPVILFLNYWVIRLFLFLMLRLFFNLFLLSGSRLNGGRSIKLLTERFYILRSLFRINLQSAAESTNNIGRNFLGNGVRNHQFVISFPALCTWRILTHKRSEYTSRESVNICCRAHFMVIIILLNSRVALVHVKLKLA